MDKIIEKVFNEKMNNGSFEKIINEKLDDMFRRVLDDMCGYCGESKKLLEQKIEPLLNSCIENYNFGDYALKLNDAFNDIIKNSDYFAAERMRLGFDKLSGSANQVKFGSEIKLSEIFDKYTDFIEECFDESDVEDILNEGDEDKYCVINCFSELKNIEGTVFSRRDNKILTLSNELAEDNAKMAIKSKIEVEIIKSYDGTHRLDFNSNIPLSELDNVPGFILYLMQVKNKCCKIIIDKEYISEDVSLTFEYEYERC